MKRYSLFSKQSNEAINSIKSSNLEGAILFFAAQKRLELDQFHKLFEVREV
jgi:hypothetical protein